MNEADDPLWRHFKPLWLEFAQAGDGILVAGGYGLFLKQQWLLDLESKEIVIPFERWPSATPRATGDMDLIVSLDLISDETANKQLLKALKQQGFEVSSQPQGKRWKFFKEIGDDRHVVVELHAPMPEGEPENLKANRFAVKHKPSLGEQGVHGRTNQEAIGSEIHPFRFELDGGNIVVPNPVTWSVMKLTAAEDMWKRSQDRQREGKDRTYFRDQAIKHGHDVCRAVAMMTIEERDTSGDVVNAIKDTPQFQRASEIYRDFFNGSENWANEVLAGQWLPEDLDVIHGILGEWFRA